MAIFERKILIEKYDLKHLTYKCYKCGYFYIPYKNITIAKYQKLRRGGGQFIWFEQIVSCPRCKATLALND